MPKSFVQIRLNLNEMENSAKKRQEAPRWLKKAQISFFQPLMIKMYCFDATRVMPPSFVQIRPNWNEAPRSAKRTKKGLDFNLSTFNDWNISFRCYVSNATKFRPDSSKLEWSAKKRQED